MRADAHFLLRPFENNRGERRRCEARDTYAKVVPLRARGNTTLSAEQKYAQTLILCAL